MLLALLLALLLLSVLEEEKAGLLKIPVAIVAGVGGSSMESEGRARVGVGVGVRAEVGACPEEEEESDAGWLVAHNVSWSGAVREGLAAAMVGQEYRKCVCLCV